MRKYVVEFVGTFLLMSAIGACGLPLFEGGWAPPFVGTVLILLIYLGAPFSGAHYNPAVTLAFWMTGKCERSAVPGYILAQLAAAALAASVARRLVGASAPLNADSIPAVLSAEAIFTFALVFVIFLTAGRRWAPIAIGGVVAVGATLVGSVSGASFNPAVTIGFVMLQLLEIGDIWLYFVAELAAAIAATRLFLVFKPDFA